MAGKASGKRKVGRAESRADTLANTEVAFYKSGQRDVARYVSDTVVYEEALDHGRWIGLYWSASGQVQRENLVDKLPAFNPLELPLHAFDLEIDGQDLRNHWEHVSSLQRPGGRPDTREAVVELRHQVRPVTVKVVTRLDGTAILVRFLEITNTGKAPAALSRVSPWSGLLWTWAKQDHWRETVPANVDPFRLGFFDSPSFGAEGNFRWEPLPRDGRRIESATGPSGYANPFFVVRNEVTGETAFGSLAWSANWYAEFWRDPYLNLANVPDRGNNLAFRMGPLGPGPLRVIAPGETIATPEMHLGILHKGFDECVAAWHGHLRSSVIPPRPKGKEFYTMAARVVEEPGEWISREIDIAAEMGVEAFMVDAGWYGDEFGNWPDRRGDWRRVGPWMPGGLAGCRKRCHSQGLLFGLWMEPEAVGPKSRLLAEHPDWILRTDDGREVAPVLDLAHPGAASFFHESVLRVIGEHRLDFFKIDYNERVREGGQRLRAGLLESELWRHCEALYGVFDEVRRTLPHVAMECCAGGGGRSDLGMMARFHYAAESDFSMFPRSIRAINGLTLFLPPEALCYYHNHMPVAHQMADLDTHLRVTLFAQPIFVGFGGQNADRSTPYFQRTRRYIELNKTFCRPVLTSHPLVFHHTPDIGLTDPKAEWCVLEYARPDHARGFAGAFKLAAGPSEYRLCLRGVDLSAEYEVTLDNRGQTFSISGRELAGTGLPIRLDSAMTSELVLYRRV